MQANNDMKRSTKSSLWSFVASSLILNRNLCSLYFIDVLLSDTKLTAQTIAALLWDVFLTYHDNLWSHQVRRKSYHYIISDQFINIVYIGTRTFTSATVSFYAKFHYHFRDICLKSIFLQFVVTCNTIISCDISP